MYSYKRLNDRIAVYCDNDLCGHIHMDCGRYKYWPKGGKSSQCTDWFDSLDALKAHIE